MGDMARLTGHAARLEEKLSDELGKNPWDSHKYVFSVKIPLLGF